MLYCYGLVAQSQQTEYRQIAVWSVSHSSLKRPDRRENYAIPTSINLRLHDKIQRKSVAYRHTAQALSTDRVTNYCIYWSTLFVDRDGTMFCVLFYF